MQDSARKLLWFCLLIPIAGLAQSTADAKPAEAEQLHRSIADFGLAYPLSNDWVRATQLLRKKLESANNSPAFDVLLAAVYVPKSTMSETNPFFSLLAYRQPATDCKKNLEAVTASMPEKKDKPEAVVQFSVGGRDYYRLNLRHGGRRHECMICTTANGRLLVWNAGAPNDKELDAIAATLNAVTALPARNAAQPPPAGPRDGEAQGAASDPAIARAQRVRVSSGMMGGLLIKKVNPTYPAEARAAYIQGTVMMQAEINQAGDITDLELLDGPIELAGSAVAAVRQWKYKPYLLMGQPIAVQTQIQVNYQLQQR